jgi:hypothetical protein
MKQVLFERGFLDVMNLNLYSKDGPTDENDKILDELFSYKFLISSLPDFVEENTLLQHMAAAIGKKLDLNITLDRSPKGHPEVAGEGIEYAWANSKIYLRQVPRILNQMHQKSSNSDKSSNPDKKVKVVTLSLKDIEKMRCRYRSHRGVERCDYAWSVATAMSTSARR